MRQALFAIVLVGASFAGGAAVNGPGLRWAQAWALGRLGLVQEHVGGTAGAATPAAEPEGEHPPEDRSIAPLALSAPGANEVAGKPADSQPAAPEEKPASPRPEPARNANNGPLAPEPGARGDQASAPAPAPAPAAGSGPLPLESTELPKLDRPEPLTVPGETDAASAAAKAPAAKTAGRGFGDVALSLASMASKAVAGGAGTEDPSAAAPPRSDPAVATAVLSAEPKDWAEVRQALRALGVSRYGTEAEPDGRARFHCVIPLAGRRAVGQHFEAEGDDELQAARAALRRVTLWRATEEPGATR